jgi:GT2 family glycosyltransferase
MYDIVASIVLYKNDAKMVERAISSFLQSELNVQLYLVDNSPDAALQKLQQMDEQRIVYIFNNKNIGFGAAHNIAIQRSSGYTKYNLILNPDVYFDSSVLSNIFNYMEGHLRVGQLAVKTLYPDDSLQFICKMLPTPFQLIARRFIPERIHFLFQETMLKYEMRHKNYDEIMNIPNLSGSFMFIRTEVLKEIGGFDENIFMYTEDVDLTRRIHSKYDTLYYPYVSVYHEYAKGSYFSFKLLKYHVKSAIYYFNKWGWFFDNERKQINRKLL